MNKLVVASSRSARGDGSSSTNQLINHSSSCCIEQERARQRHGIKRTSPCWAIAIRSLNHQSQAHLIMLGLHVDDPCAARRGVTHGNLFVRHSEEPPSRYSRALANRQRCWPRAAFGMVERRGEVVSGHERRHERRQRHVGAVPRASPPRLNQAIGVLSVLEVKGEPSCASVEN